MLFSSPLFVFGFLPAFMGCYYLTPRQFRTLVLLVASCVFYAWWQAIYLLLILGIAAVSYVAGAISVNATSPSARQWAVRAGIAVNLGVLAWFKYAYFVAGTFDEALSRLGADASTGVSLPEIILPIGLSFLVFQSISYILDVARGDAPAARSLINFLAFSTLFPQLIAGPILRYKDLAEQFETRDHSMQRFVAGLRRFVLGLAMKLLIADSVAPLADRIFALQNPLMGEAWLGAVAYAIQLFFDFAGYSAMAIGLGLMVGFTFVENFNAPYTARSVTEFWQRWHISLSNWLRDYLYVPLGGNRTGQLKTYRNLILTMVLGGLWHGANWTFVLWGIWHGGLMALERALGAKHKASVWPPAFSWPLTMIFVLIGWVMFRASSVSDAITMYVGMSGWNGFGFAPETLILTGTSELLFLALGCLLAIRTMLPTPSAVTLTVAMPGAWRASLSTLQTLGLFMLCTLIMQARTDSPFLYFQF